MLGLPRSTEFNKRIPKQKFYDNLTVTPALKRCFVEQVRVIYWKNKIAVTTTNLAAGKSVDELQVFEIRLSQRSLDEGVLRQIDKEIPYHILYLLEYEGKYQAWIAYKETASSGCAAFKVNQYYHTNWMPEEELPLKLEGRSVDAVYENFIRQIAGEQLTAAPAESLRDSVERSRQRAALQKQIDKLQAKIRKEKQLNRQMEMNIELKSLQRKLEALYHGQ